MRNNGGSCRPACRGDRFWYQRSDRHRGTAHCVTTRQRCQRDHRTDVVTFGAHSELLVQIADFDQYVPADAVAATASHGRAQVHRYPCDHFDVWPGHDWFDKAADDQVVYLDRALRTQ